jgi:thiosulfate dehydrogenase
MKRAISLFCALAAVACHGQSAPGVTELTAVDHGRALFSDPKVSSSTLNAVSCATCHHTVDDPSDTRIITGVKLAGAPERASYWAGQEIELLRAINDCRYYFMQARAPWSADEEDARAIWAYLSSLPKGDRKPLPFTVVRSVVDLPPGDRAVGQDVYARACHVCHGAIHTGEGKSVAIASTLPDQTNAQHASYSQTDQRVIFIEKIRHGGFLSYGGVMPPFSQEVLTDAQLAGLLTYLGLYP